MKKKKLPTVLVLGGKWKIFPRGKILLGTHEKQLCSCKTPHAQIRGNAEFSLSFALTCEVYLLDTSWFQTSGVILLISEVFTEHAKIDA